MKYVLSALMSLLLLAAAPAQELDERAQSPRARETFGKALPYLEDAAERFDRHGSLPASRWFGPDQVSNEAAINDLLDEAIGVLGVSQVGDVRGRIRALEAEMEGARAEIAGYRERRVSAPSAEEPASGIDQYNPFRATKEDYDEKIGKAEARIAAAEAQMAELRADFANGLRAMGIEVSEEGVDSLLATVSGDDFVSMCIVFDNLKLVTATLHDLTEETGEDPVTARRYYGMYVIIARVLDRIQSQYITRIREEHIPDLEALAEKAKRNIDEARQLLRASRSDRAALESNIAANEMTIAAARYYVDYLREMAGIIEAQHEETERILATAVNTYKTVDVSVNVSELIALGSANLDRLMKLKMPQLRAFDNTALRREYARLSDHMAR